MDNIDPRTGAAASADVSIDTQILIGKIKDKVATFDPADVFNRIVFQVCLNSTLLYLFIHYGFDFNMYLNLINMCVFIAF